MSSQDRQLKAGLLSFCQRSLGANVHDLKQPQDNELKVFCCKDLKLFSGNKTLPTGRAKGYSAPGALSSQRAHCEANTFGRNTLNASSNQKPPVAFRQLQLLEIISAAGRRCTLTLERSDEHIPILDELFDEFICPLKFDFMAFDALSEIRTVQKRVTELQSGESHCGKSFPSRFKMTADEIFGFSSRICVFLLRVPQKVLLLLQFLTSAQILAATFNEKSGGGTPAGQIRMVYNRSFSK